MSLKVNPLTGTTNPDGSISVKPELTVTYAQGTPEYDFILSVIQNSPDYNPNYYVTPTVVLPDTIGYLDVTVSDFSGSPTGKVHVDGPIAAYIMGSPAQGMGSFAVVGLSSPPYMTVPAGSYYLNHTLRFMGRLNFEGNITQNIAPTAPAPTPAPTPTPTTIPPHKKKPAPTPTPTPTPTPAPVVAPTTAPTAPAPIFIDTYKGWNIYQYQGQSLFIVQDSSGIWGGTFPSLQAAETWIDQQAAPAPAPTLGWTIVEVRSGWNIWQLDAQALFTTENVASGVYSNMNFYSLAEAEAWCDQQAAPSGCFIATACYGSPTHPKVNALRAIKDRMVTRSKVASVAYRLYYVFSPAVALKIRAMPRVKAFIRKTIEVAWRLL